MSAKFLIQVHDTSPYLYGWSVEGDTFTQLSMPNPGSGCQCARFSNDGVYLAVGRSGATDTIRLYKRTGTSFALVHSTSITGGNVMSLRWSSNGDYLIAGASQSLYLFARTGDTLALRQTVNTGRTIYGGGRNFDYAQGYLAVGFDSPNTTSAVWVYKHEGDSLNLLVNLTTAPVNFVPSMGVCISSDGLYLLSVSGDATAGRGQRMWKRDGDTFNQLFSNHAFLDGKAIDGCCFSTKAEYLIAHHAGGGTYYLLTRTGDVFTLAQTFSTSSTNLISMNFSGDTLHFGRQGTSASAPFATIHKRTLDSLAQITAPPGFQTGTFSRATEWWPNVNGDSVFKPISGHVYDQAGNPISRTVRSHVRESGNFAGEAVSDPTTGAYSLDAYGNTEHYVVVLDDTRNAMIFDHIIPVLQP